MKKHFDRFYENYLLETLFKSKIFPHEGGFMRVKKVFDDVNSTPKDKIAVLKQEFGTGGFGWKGFNADYSPSKGLTLRVRYFDGREFKYTWAQVIKMFEELGKDVFKL